MSPVIVSETELKGWMRDSMRGKLLRAGFTNPDSIPYLTLPEAESKINTSNLVIGLGERVLQSLTGKRSIDKWVVSPLERLTDGGKFIGTYDFNRVMAQYELNLYIDLALKRAHDETTSRDYARTPERFRLNPSIEETLALLKDIRNEPTLSVDTETGYGQINTVGFAWSESDAIAINVLPDRCGSAAYYELWKGIAEVMEGPGRKVFQNFIYDVSYFSAYGIKTNNIHFDTMWAMKVLYPELKSNLGNVGRFYTKRVYWKDDGKVTDEESGKRDWGRIRDWTKHYLYNCRDTTGTFDASRAQQEDLTRRGLLGFYFDYLAKLKGPIQEMCANGMPLDLSVRECLKNEAEAKLNELKTLFEKEVGRPINPRSPKQIQAWLASEGIKLPKKYDKKKGEHKDSTDSKSIKKIRLKHPELKALEYLQEIKSYDKAFSSYINFSVRPDNCVSYSLNGCGTETLRWSGSKDPWDRGFNIQTIPREGGDVSIKSMFVAPEGYSFIEADLSQAETRYVAYASACSKLIEMLESGADIHKHVAHAILRALNLPASDYSKLWRDLGKKTGHGANYMMKENTFIENVFNEMDYVLTPKQGRLILDSYFQEFPEIKVWHNEIKRELYQKRKLTAPTGWERYFYGRPDDNTLREAIPWAPQHTIPFITNKMMLHLWDLRKEGKLRFHFITQVHDALYMLMKDECVEDVAEACLSIRDWQKGFDLPGGRLLIPCEVETAKCLANKEKYTLKRKHQ